MKTDIRSREDIQRLVDQFYDKVMQDALLQNFFNEKSGVHFETHLPIMYDFWEAMLFQTKKHRGDLMARHVVVDQKFPTQKEHYTQWAKLFCETVDELFEGEKASIAKNYTNNLANIIHNTVKQSRNSMWNKLR